MVIVAWNEKIERFMLYFFMQFCKINKYMRNSHIFV